METVTASLLWSDAEGDILTLLVEPLSASWEARSHDHNQEIYPLDALDENEEKTGQVSGSFAAFFTGSVNVSGNFVTANGTKSAAVPHADGTMRLVYCMESPENWFEDFGKAKLVNGKADVKIDADFATIVHTDDYHVFLTAYGNTNGLHITKQTLAGFSVEEHNGGANSLGFSYRIVARRKDVKAERLAKYTLPKIHIPDVAAAPRAVKANAPAPLPNRKP